MLALELLGPPVLRRDGQALPLTVRKTQALLVLLARSGAMPRGRIAALLWPELDESAGRRNLRRELARLREAGAGAAIVSEADRLALAADLTVDAQAFGDALAAGRPEAALALWRGLPADGLVLEDAPAFGDWLTLERERLQRARQQALAAVARVHEARGDAAAALGWVQTLLAEDPLQEQHHRDAMRLLAACGRREAALAQYLRCRTLLHDELGLAPTAETEDLAASLRGAAAGAESPPEPGRGQGRAPSSRLAPGLAPASIVRAPVPLPEKVPFVGRGREILSLEAAWRAGRAVLIEGEAGVGKTRLALDFAAAHGPWALARCRPGDADVPYLSFTRALRTLAGAAPSVDDLAPWVRVELARLLPELGPMPPPLRSDEQRGRFFEACALAWQALTAEDFDAVLLDDWHLADSASLALLTHVAQRRRDQAAAGAREWLLLRPELDAEARGRLIECLRPLCVRLQPLDDEAVLELVRQLSGSDSPMRFAARLRQATGGNPFFVTETLRHLAENDWLSAGEDGVWHTPFDDATQDYRELPVPASVRDAVLARVQRLDAATQRVLECAALASEPFLPALLAPACALSELATVFAIEQAVKARLVREHESGGFGFAHDLVRQALEGALGGDRRRLVHRRLALGAESSGAPPAIAAQHHEASGEPGRAAPLRLAAGDQAERLHALPQAVEHWQRGLLDQPAPRVAVRLHLRLLRCLRWLGRLGDAETQVLALRALTDGPTLDPADRLEALIDVAGHLARNGRPAEGLAVLEALPPADDPAQGAIAQLQRVDALRELGRTDESRAVAAALLANPHLPPARRADLLDAMVLIEQRAGRTAEVLDLLVQAEGLCRQLGDDFGITRGLYRRGSLLFNLADLAGAETAFNAGLTLSRRMGMAANTLAFLQGLCEVYQARGEMDALLDVLHQAWASPLGPPGGMLGYVFRSSFVVAHSARGEWGEAWGHLQAALDMLAAVPRPHRLEAASCLPLELLGLLGDRRGLAHVLDALTGAMDSAPALPDPTLADRIRLQLATCELAAGDPAAAGRHLAGLSAESMTDPALRIDRALAECAVRAASGHPGFMGAEDGRLPADAAELTGPQRARLLALRVAAQCRAGGPQATTVLEARTLLAGQALERTLPAPAALALHRALAAAGVPGAAQACQAFVGDLSQSLADHPAQQAALQAVLQEAKPASPLT